MRRCEVQRRLARAETLLAEGAFWEAHEVLEPLWLALPRRSPAAARVKAVIQLAAALHKPWQPLPFPEAPLEEGARRILDRARAGWRAGAHALPAPPSLERAFHAAVQTSAEWIDAASRARAAHAAAPPGAPGVSLPLSLWSAGLAAVLAATKPA